MSFFIIAVFILGIAYTAYLPFHALGITWMGTLYKPTFAPPGWLESVVWPILYLLMSTSLWLIWQKKEEQPINIALWTFLLQYLVNISWGPVIINMQDINLSMLYICALFPLVLINTRVFWHISESAGLLLVPNVLWTFYLLCVQTTIWLH